MLEMGLCGCTSLWIHCPSASSEWEEPRVARARLGRPCKRRSMRTGRRGPRASTGGLCTSAGALGRRWLCRETPPRAPLYGAPGCISIPVPPSLHDLIFPAPWGRRCASTCPLCETWRSGRSPRLRHEIEIDVTAISARARIATSTAAAGRIRMRQLRSCTVIVVAHRPRYAYAQFL